MTIRCDEPMRRSKEKARVINTQIVGGISVPKWKCTGDCYNCICGIVTTEDGTESHVKPTR